MFELEASLVESMWQSITTLEAQEQLMQMSVQDWSHMKKAQRTKLHKELFKKAYPSEIRKKNYISAEDLAKVLGR
jgi:Zn/Cd-binding protein ZinT